MRKQFIFLLLFYVSALNLRGDLAQSNTSKATNTLIAYFNNLVIKNIVDKEDLEYLLKQDAITDPIFGARAHTSHEKFIHGEQINKLLGKSHNQHNLETIKSWAALKLEQLREHITVRDTVQEKTRPVYIPMSFVSLPKGVYKNPLDGHAITISEGIEIQETLVTQYQWARIMGENSAFFTNGHDSEEVVVNGKKIRMRANAPIENVSYEQIQEFLKRLNEQNSKYWYDLPSVDEYFILPLAFLGENWATQIAQTINTSTLSNYLECNKQRIWSVIGTCWQWTRDSVNVELKIGQSCTAHLVFGTSQITDKTTIKTVADLVRPIVYDNSTNKYVSLRLSRYPKNSTRSPYTYNSYYLPWNQATAQQDQEWEWHNTVNLPILFDDSLPWLLDHAQSYSPDLQKTLRALTKKASSSKNTRETAYYLKNLKELYLDSKALRTIIPLKYLLKLERLFLNENKITDITPLSKLTNLTFLSLTGNLVHDVMPLSLLTNLKDLFLSNNRISDITPLNSLTKLQELYLFNNKIDTITSLTSLITLKTLFLDLNQVSDITPLAHLTNLEVLDIASNNISEISPLRSLTNLNSLAINNNKIQSIEPLVALPRLRKLDIAKNPLRNQQTILELLQKNGVSLST